MKKIILIVFATIFSVLLYAQEKNISIADTSKKIFRIEMACGQCQFHMDGKGCNLAVKIKGKTYFVEGAGIDDFGDAHASDGFCKAVRKAEAQGEIVNDKFVATYLKLLLNTKK